MLKLTLIIIVVKLTLIFVKLNSAKVNIIIVVKLNSAKVNIIIVVKLNSA